MMVKPAVRFLSAAVLIVAWQFSIPVANAQWCVPELATSASEISDQKLDAAAAVIERLAVLQQMYRQRLASAAAPPDQKRTIAEATDALTKVVEDRRLSIDEYNSIIEVAQNDPEIRQKVLERIHPLGEHL